MERSATARASLIPPKPVPSFELLFRPSVNLIHVVRCFVTDFYAKVVVEPDTVQRLALATHELLENAHKYSNDGDVALFVECDIESGAVSARTMNRASTARSEEHTSELQSHLNLVCRLLLEKKKKTITVMANNMVNELNILQSAGATWSNVASIRYGIHSGRCCYTSPRLSAACRSVGGLRVTPR